MRVLKVLLFICSLVFLSSCARPGKKETKLNFVLGAQFVSAGDAMLWGKNISNGEAFGRVISLDPVEIDLSFGQWNFYVTAWGGGDAFKPLQGKAVCDHKVVMIDDTTATPEVAFNLDNGKCASPAFGPAVNTVTTNHPSNATVHYFPPLRLDNCQDVNQLTSAGDYPNCTRGFYNSYKIFVKEFGAGSLGNELASDCVIANTSDGKMSDTLIANLPHGDGVAPFQYVIRAYFGNSTCDETADPLVGDATGFREFVFLDGLNGQSPGVRKMDYTGTACIFSNNLVGTGGSAGACDGSYVMCNGGAEDGRVVLSATCTSAGGSASTVTNNYNTGAVKTNLVLPSSEADVCTPERMYSQFAGGDGTTGRPYLICTPNQFNGIDNDSVLMGKNFELVNDLDFNLSTNSNCPIYGIAVNLNPIGGGIDPASVPACQPQVSRLAFSGTFDGRGHDILFARIRNGGLQGGGLFYSLSGATVKNINIVGGEFGIASDLGALAGSCSGATVDMIFLEDVMMDGEDDGAGNSYTGGLFGQSNGCTISNVYSYGTEVKGRGSYVGGLIGNSSGDTITSVDVFGGVESRPDFGVTASFVGGIVGKSQSSISQAVMHGGVTGGTNVGGIAGAGSTAGHSISNSYVLAHINGTQFRDNNDLNPVNVGGIIGSSNMGSVTQTFFMGSIEHQCKIISNPATCRVGKFAGITTGTALDAGNGIENYTQLEYSAFGTLGGHSGTQISWADFKDTSHTANFLDFDFVNIWTHVPGDIPRLIRHDWPCEQASNLASVTAQIAAGRGGSYENAIKICNVDQMKQIKSNVNKIYRLADNFSLFGYLDSDAPAAFSGELWGDDYVIFGGIISSTNTTYGIFKDTVAGSKISNLNIAGFQNLSSGYNTQAALVGFNQGLIHDVSVQGGYVEGSTGVGLIAGINGENGTIKNVSVSGVVKGYNQVGGVVGKNMFASNKSGQIVKAKAFVELLPSSPAAQRAGGIVGENYGYMDQVMSGSRVFENGTNYFDAIGGIAGKNLHDGGTTALGTISNASNSGYGEIRVTSANFVGGIVGVNQGPIDKTVVEGRITKDAGAGIPTTWGAIVGSDSGGNVTTRNYYNLDPFRYMTGPLSLTTAVFDGTNTVVTLTGFTFTVGNPPSDYLRLDYDQDALIPIMSYTATNILLVAGDQTTLINSAGTIDIFQLQNANNFGTKLAGTAFYDIDSYCSGASLGDKYFTCTNGGFDITEEYQGMDGVGTQRVLDYYMADMNGLTLPSHPIWVLEPGNNNPPRLFIENND